jgi:hypothetical protein
MKLKDPSPQIFRSPKPRNLLCGRSTVPALSLDRRFRSLEFTTSHFRILREVLSFEPPIPRNLCRCLRSTTHNPGSIQRLQILNRDFMAIASSKALPFDPFESRVSEMLHARHASFLMDGPDYFMNSPFMNLLLSSPSFSRCQSSMCVDLYHLSSRSNENDFAFSLS